VTGRALAAGLVAVLLVGGAHRPADARADDDPRVAVQRLLDARAAAVASGDRGVWLAAVDPGAPAAFRTAQGQVFDGLRSLPLASYSLTVRTADTGDLGPAVAGRYPGATRVYLPETRQVYRLRDYDDRDAVDSLYDTYVERAGRWYVAGDDDLSALGLDTARNIWDLGPVRVKPTAHFLVISHPEQAARADALAGIAEEAIATQIQRWDRPWLQRIPLILPGSVHELEVILQSTFDLNNFVAFVVYGDVRDGGWAATAPRIYIQDRNLARYDHAFQVQTLVHELTHAASVPRAGPFIPSWVHEGSADWVARGESTTEHAPKGSDGVLPRDYEFSTGGSVAIVRAYDESRSAMSYLAATRGPHAVSQLFATLGAVKVAPGSVDYQTGQALRQVAGAGLEQFQHQWARW
jgi:hypothetical protein